MLINISIKYWGRVTGFKGESIMTIRKASDEGRLGTLMASLGQIVKAHPGKLVLVFVLLTATMVPPLMGMDTSTSMEDFAPESEFLDGAEVMRSEFEPSTSAMVIIESEHGSMSDREGLQVLTATEEAIYASEGLTPHLAPNSTAVVTLAGPVATYIAMASNGSLDMSSAPDGLLEQAVTNVLSDPSASMLVSEGGEGRYALVVVNLVPTGDQVEQESVEKDLELAVEDVLPDGYRMHSYLVFSEKMREDTVEGLGLLMPLALLLVVAVLWFALRSVRDVVISILGVVTILIISLGIYSLTGMGFSQLLFFGPILILVLSIDFAIHILYRYNEIRRQGDLPVAAMGRSIGLVGVAVLVSALTTAVAFGSNGLSAIPAVAGFGVFLGIGISVSFIVMTLFVPSMKLLVEARRPTTPRPARRSRRTGGSRLVRATTMYPKGVVVVAVLLFAGSLAVAGDISNDMSSRDALSPDSEVVQAIDILEAEFPVTGAPRAFVLVTGDVTDPRNMVALDEFIFRAGAIPQVARIDGEPSIGSILPLLRVVTLTADNGTGTLDGDGDGIPDTREGMGSVLWSLWSDGVEGLAGPGEIRRILSVDDAGTSFDGVLVAIETADRDVGDTGVP
jgi:predicted RND superfamily exporter protein